MKMTIRQIGENKYKREWKPSKAEAFYISVIAFAVIYLIFQVVRGYL